MTELHDTSGSEIAAAIVSARRAAGSPAMGMVMTLVLAVAEDHAEQAMEAARTASREHPARILGVVLGDGRGRPRVDAEVGIGHGASGETALIRLRGEVTRHAASVVLPLLLPDSPVVVWWPARSPDDPAADPLGALGTRRITDAAAAPHARTGAMLTQCRSYAPGNTDLAWTRITPWRALLAAALEQSTDRVVSASVAAAKVSPSADLLAAWLADRLRVPVTRTGSPGPGITSVALDTRNGAIRVDRPDGMLATLSSPGEPDRPVALRRRDTAELLAEELRRLDPDEVYSSTVRRLVRREGTARSGGALTSRGPRRPGKRS